MTLNLDNITFLDGGLGTMLQQRGMTPAHNPITFGIENKEILTAVHREYINAGSDIICCNSFGLNPIKAQGLDLDLNEAIKTCIDAAKDARNTSANKESKIAFDIGPIGILIEPMGPLSFEAAYDSFRTAITLAEKHGADLVLIETMTDITEIKAAILATKENTKLPILASMSFEANGRTFTGVSLETMVLTLENLGIDAIGINCSLGPVEIYPLAEKLVSLTDLPILIKPNAGLPNPETGSYDLDCDSFVKSLSSYRKLGISMVGGCCGTTPQYISGLVKELGKNTPITHRSINSKSLKVCSRTKSIEVNSVTVVGERLNPTGKKLLQKALHEEDYGYIAAQAIKQVEEGAEILDVNVGAPGLNQVTAFPKVIKKIQEVTDVPLQIDSSDPEAIEAALRAYNGKAIVNSVNGEEESLSKILPIVKKYGAAVIGLTLDDNGLPTTSDQRFSIAKKIYERATLIGIKKEDIIIDCLALTVSAQQDQALETIKAIKRVTEELGLKTTLGVSNISFGLPVRSVINTAFLTLAMEAGLTLPIMDPSNSEMMGAISAFKVLNGIDKNSGNYISKYAPIESAQKEASKQISEKSDLQIKKNPLKNNLSSTNFFSTQTNCTDSHPIFHAIANGLTEETESSVSSLLKEHDPMEIVNNYLIKALDFVGKDFEQGTTYLPQMMQSAQAAQAGFDVIKRSILDSGGKSVAIGKIALATVEGDIHDIGKNIVKIILENYGFEIIDLGKDVPVEKVVDTVIKHDLKLIGLSALMTSTLFNMERTIAEVKKVAPDCKVMVGGAVLTHEYAKKIQADFCCLDALSGVEASRKIFQ